MFSINPLQSVFEDFSTGNASNGSCLEPDPVMWVYEVFNECIYNTKEEIGFLFGLVSIVCWICSSLPQLYENYKKGKVDEALSFWFLLLWLFGDSSNLIGCVLTKQFPIQLYTAVYYVSMDLIMIFQFSYYSLKHRRMLNRAGTGGVINEALTRPGAKPAQSLICCLCLSVFLPLAIFNQNRNLPYQAYSSESRIGRTLLSVDKDSSFIVWTPETIIGYAIGCVSSAFYLGSRLPQILKNHERRQTDGVSPVMFTLAVAGNLLYGASILMQDPQDGHSWSEFLVFHLPWLVGSLGTLSLDFFILSQILYYNNKCCCVLRIKPQGLLEESDEDNNALLV